MFKSHASVQDLQALLEKRYIYQFESGVIVIKHWRMANALRKDRYTPTAFQEELAQLGIKENGAYTWLPDGCQVVAERLPQDRVGKDRLVEVREEESIEPPAAAPAPPKPTKHKRGTYGWVLLTDDEYDRLVSDLGEAEATRCINYVDEAAEQTGNKNKWKNWNLTVRKCHREGWGLRSRKQDTGFQTDNPFLEMLEERRNGYEL